MVGESKCNCPNLWSGTIQTYYLDLDSYEYSKYVNITQAQYNRDMVSVEFDIMRVSMVFHNTFREVLIMSNSTYSHAQLVYRINVINAV